MHPLPSDLRLYRFARRRRRKFLKYGPSQCRFLIMRAPPQHRDLLAYSIASAKSHAFQTPQQFSKYGTRIKFMQDLFHDHLLLHRPSQKLHSLPLVPYHNKYMIGP